MQAIEPEAASVTAANSAETDICTRNAMLLAEFMESWERKVRESIEQPDIAALLLALKGAAKIEETWESELASFMERASANCSKCRADFNRGDVVYRRRVFNSKGREWVLGFSWKLESICDNCVGKWHKSWRAHRWSPIPCVGGCGLMVSGWGKNPFIYCSTRCQEIGDQQRRRYLLVKRKMRQCSQCHRNFVPSRADGRYCSNACRQRSYRTRASSPADTPA